jgi:large subunit ribosomal protein L21
MSVTGFNRRRRKIAKEKESINLEELTVKELKELAKEKGLEGYTELKKAELIDLLK